jgi:TolA-binding protein
MKPIAQACVDDRVPRARRGALSPDEWQDFATHLAGCTDCRIAWRLAVDFDQSAAAEPLDERIIGRGVNAAMDTSPRARVGIVRFATAAAVLLAAAGVASGAMILHKRYVATAQDPVASPSARIGKVRGPGASNATPLAASTAPTAVVENIPPAALPSLPMVTKSAPAQTAPPKHPKQLASVVPVAQATSPLEPSPQVENASALFARAVAERKQGRVFAAVASFRSLERRFPDSTEAVVSLVSVGDLLLGADDAAQALIAFEGYLVRAPNGTLAPEAWVGKARALESLGRTEEAKAAWRELARQLPDSPYARRARDSRSGGASQ